MSVKRRGLCLFLLCSLFIFCSGVFAAPQNTVFTIPVEGEIGPGWLQFLERSLAEAEEGGAEAVIILLNTPGGYINSAVEARKLLDDTPYPIYAFVNPHALSAGAYLALSADKIFMAPGSTMGAAEPREAGSTEPADEKTLSYWEGEMKAMAERRGRDPELAAAMVRQEIAIEGVVESGKLLTLTAQEAENLGFSDATISNLNELLEKTGLYGAHIVPLEPAAWDQIGGWLINPVVSTAILTLAFVLLIFEVLSAGFGVTGLCSILCFGLYFGGHFFAGVSGWPAIFLFLLGVILLLVEAFIPGFGVFGVSGIVAFFVSIILSSASAAAGLQSLLISLLISIVVGFLAFKYFQRKGILRRFINQEALTSELGYRSSTDFSFLLGKQCVTVTPLRPAGIMEADGARFDVVSEGEFIGDGEQVIVSKVEGNRIVVRPIKKGE